MKATLKGVRVRACVGDDEGFFVVGPVFDGVDRPYTHGWQVKEKNVKRLTAALEGEAAKVAEHKVLTDVNGKTYVSFDIPVRARTLNADLKRLGY